MATRADAAAVRHARSPWTILRHEGWVLVKETWAELGKDNIGLIAAGTAFYGFAAIVPMLAATVLIYGLVATPESLTANINALFGVLPKDAASLIGDQLATVVKTSGDKKGFGLVVALALALYGATSAASSFVTALNIAYEETETRGFVKLYLLAFAIVVGAVVMALVAVASTTVLAFVDSLIPWAPEWLLTLIRFGSYVVLAAMATTAAAVLYRYGPDRRHAKWSWLTPGSLVAMLLWLVATLGFGLYVSKFGNYGATYGSLSAVVVLLTWLWLSAYVFLLGAEVNSQIERRTAVDTTDGPPAPPGQRGAAVADMVVSDAKSAPAPVPAPSPAPRPHPVATAAGIKAAARVAGRPVGLPSALLAGAGLAAIKRDAVARGAVLLSAAVALAWLRRTRAGEK